ncbi:MAG: sulfite exporter TauE/SafE family protein [Hyphomicrobiales bacterium]|nr:sulfite exporter TauE/SafE family protein [Hyphomicrobiales bacterium]
MAGQAGTGGVIVGHDTAAALSGSLVGFVLGLVGGGGSILAVPLLVYVVGVASPHVAIGTSAIAVAFSALANLVSHARAGHVRWACASVFSLAGMMGAFLGSALGKNFDGQKLLLLFGILMIVIAIVMLRRKPTSDSDFKPLCRETARDLLPRLGGMGVAVGALSGFFGIGGGFLIVPGLIASARMPMVMAVGSSLVSVAAFGLTTAASYAWSGLIDWRVAGIFIGGGLLGGVAGTAACGRLAASKAALTRIFASLVICVGLYVVVRGFLPLIP